MNKQLTAALAVICCAPMAAQADIKFYGKANVSYASVKADAGDAETSIVELSSNASRLGIKGSEKINDSLEAIYQAEYEVYVDDGKGKNDQTFGQRNIYVGLKGNFGSVIAGNFDTPLKRIQKKVDLFGDLYGDIKNQFTHNDNRKANSLMYISPKMAGFALYGDLIASEEEDTSNGTSMAVTYENGGFYGAIAHDLDVEDDGASATRGVIQYNLNALQLGLLVEEEESKDGVKTDGVFASVKYKLGSWALKAQVGQSDIKDQDGETLSLGADYKLSKNAKVFGFYTSNGYTEVVGEDAEAIALDVSEDALGVGLEVKF